MAVFFVSLIISIKFDVLSIIRKQERNTKITIYSLELHIEIMGCTSGKP